MFDKKRDDEGDNALALDEVLGPDDAPMDGDPVIEIEAEVETEMSPEETLAEVSRMVEEMGSILKRTGI